MADISGATAPIVDNALPAKPIDAPITSDTLGNSALVPNGGPVDAFAPSSADPTPGESAPNETKPDLPPTSVPPLANGGSVNDEDKKVEPLMTGALQHTDSADTPRPSATLPALSSAASQDEPVKDIKAPEAPEAAPIGKSDDASLAVPTKAPEESNGLTAGTSGAAPPPPTPADASATNGNGVEIAAGQTTAELLSAPVPASSITEKIARGINSETTNPPAQIDPAVAAAPAVGEKRKAEDDVPDATSNGQDALESAAGADAERPAKKAKTGGETKSQKGSATTANGLKQVNSRGKKEDRPIAPIGRTRRVTRSQGKADGAGI